MFFKINTSNFQEMFLDMFKKFSWKKKKAQLKTNKNNFFFNKFFLIKKNSF